MLTSATKQKHWHRTGSVWVAGPGQIKKKHVTSKRKKHATNFSFKLLVDLLEVRGFSFNFNEERSCREYPTSTYLLSVDSQHNNYNYYNSVTI